VSLVLRAPAPAGAADAPAPAPASLDGALPPMRDEARALYDRGLSLYQGRDYAGAVAAFESGYALDPRREFLFAEAQAKRLAGDCRGAVPLYQRFLADSPPDLQVNATHIALGRCAQQLASARVEPRLASAPPPPPPPPPPAPLPWTHDRWGATLLGAGVVSLGLGAGFLAASYAARSDAGPLPDYRAHRALAGSRLDIAVGGLAGGTALVAGGLLRYAWARRHPTLQLGVALAPSGLLLGGSF
jgi:tetratricopeptide (TPR) repeat protein